MAQGFGYLLAGLGPIGLGALHSATGGWTVPLAALGGLLVLQLDAETSASKERHVLAAGTRRARRGKPSSASPVDLEVVEIHCAQAMRDRYSASCRTRAVGPLENPVDLRRGEDGGTVVVDPPRGHRSGSPCHRW